MPVGKHDKDKEPFTQNTVQLNKGDEPSGLDSYSIKATPIDSADSQILWLNHLGQTSVNWNN